MFNYIYVYISVYTCIIILYYVKMLSFRIKIEIVGTLSIFHTRISGVKSSSSPTVTIRWY